MCYLIYYLDSLLKGMKSVPFHIWSRSYVKHKGDLWKLLATINFYRYIRYKHKLEQLKEAYIKYSSIVDTNYELKLIKVKI